MILYKDDIKRLEQIREHINSKLGDVLSIENLCNEFSISRTKLQRHFKYHFKESVHGYILATRMIAAKSLLNSRNDTVARIAVLVGYKDRSSFTRAFAKFFKQKPIDNLK